MASTSTHRSNRNQALSDNPRADVLIIGGGINGISVFRELALQGVNVTLVEANDYCSGASAASSHMVHGGIRYLENGELRLVRESLQERNRLLTNAPHYVRPLRTVIPIFSLFSGLFSAPLKMVTHKPGPPKERGATLIKIGLMIYDLFGRNQGKMPRHSFMGRKKSLQHVPGLNPDVKFTAHYYDASMENPERIALDVLHDALATGPHARAANYLAATGFNNGSVTLTDTITGDTIDFEAPVIVNTSGPWTDVTNNALGLPTAYMGGTKGSHIVIDHKELFDACNGQEIFFENKDGRIVLLFPVLGKVLIGTTDIPVDSPDGAECTDEEIDYFIDLVGHVFPRFPIDRSHIVFKFSGVRPLPAAGDLAPGLVSRDYRIVDQDLATGQKLLSLVGGKWTTFRALGEHLANDVLAILGVKRTTHTENLPIGGGKGFPETAQQRAAWVTEHGKGLAPERVEQLLARYGTRATEIIESEKPGEAHLASLPGYTPSEIATLVQTEQVVRLSDLIHRRTSLGFTGQITSDAARELAEIVAKECGWSAAEQEKELASVTHEGAAQHGA